MMTRILGTVFAGLVGLAFGSFLNVCLSRWPAGESVVAPRSHCRGCGRTLAWWENVPLASWIALRGRCRTCRVWIGWRYPIVELAVGGLWASCAWDSLGAMLLPASPSGEVVLADALGKMTFYWLLVALAVLDVENLWLPDWLTLPGVVAGFLVTLFLAPLDDFWWGDRATAKIAAIDDLINILIAAGLVLLIRWIYWLIRRREGLGLGDVKLMAMLAAWLWLPGALLSFGIGVVFGALAALVLLLFKPKQDQAWALTKLPLGTFLCIGGIVSELWGQRIIDAYLRWAGF